MKTYRAFPTRHPHWIDEEEYFEPRKTEGGFLRKRFGISFPMAFAIVLVLHLCILLGIYVANSLKPKVPRSSREGEALKARVEGPRSDALAKNEWPHTGATPEVKALPRGLGKVVLAPKPTTAVGGRVSGAPERVVARPPVPATVAKPIDSALKQQFLASRNGARPTQETREARRALPVGPRMEPLVAAKIEVESTSMPDQAVATTVTPETRSAPVLREYTLSPGDNLYAVSRRLQVSYKDLMVENGLTDPRELRVGQKLKVPARKSSS